MHTVAACQAKSQGFDTQQVRQVAKDSPTQPDWIQWVQKQKESARPTPPPWPTDGTAGLEDMLRDPLIIEQEEWADYRQQKIELALQAQKQEEEVNIAWGVGVAPRHGGWHAIDESGTQEMR